MADKIYKDIWIKGNDVAFFFERFNHSFNDSEFSFKLTRRLNKDDDPLLISICNSFKRKAGDEIVTFRFEDDIASAKKMIEASIKVFDQKQNVNIYQIKDYFGFYVEVKNNERNAAAFVDHFENISNKVEPNGTLIVKKPPHIPMRHRNGGIQEGILQIKEEEKIMSDERRNDPAQIDDYINNLKGNVLPKNNNTQTVKMPNQGETPPLERRNNNSKEHIMSDVEEQRELSPKEKAFMNAVHQRKVIADAVKAGTLSCLPGNDGYADTSPAYNILYPDKFYHGATLLYLKEHQKEHGYPTGEYITHQKIVEAQNDKPGLHIMSEEKGVSLHISEKNDVTGDYEEKHIRLFNVAQLNKPWEIKKWAEHKLEEDRQERDEYLKSQYGSNYKPPEPKPKEPGPEIVCSSTEPEKYLGQYLAAVSMGGKFKASPEQAAEFSEKMLKTLYAPMESRKNDQTGETIPPPKNKMGEIATNPFSLEKLSINASRECKEFMRDLRMRTQQQNQPGQKQEQTLTKANTW